MVGTFFGLWDLADIRSFIAPVICTPVHLRQFLLPQHMRGVDSIMPQIYQIVYCEGYTVKRKWRIRC